MRDALGAIERKSRTPFCILTSTRIKRSQTEQQRYLSCGMQYSYCCDYLALRDTALSEANKYHSFYSNEKREINHAIITII